MRIFTILCFLPFLLAGCNKHQQLVNDLDGTWEIRSISSLEETDANFPAEGSITFAKCGERMEQGGECSGSFQLANEAEVSFIYSAFNMEQDEKIINIHPANYEEPYLLSGAWSIVDKDRNELVIEGLLTVNKGANSPQEIKDVRVQIALEK